MPRSRALDGTTWGWGSQHLDLDNFKLVNDSLVTMPVTSFSSSLADRLPRCTRETDLVARQGGDEFLLLLADLDRGVGQPRDRGGGAGRGVGGGEGARGPRGAVRPRRRRVLHVGFDGVSLFPQDATDATSLLRNADTAMYQSKKMAPGGSTCTRAGPTTRSIGSPSPRGCGGRSSRNTGCCTGSPWSTWPTARRRASRRDPLAGSERRDRPARRVHPDRRRAGADRGDRGLGDRRAGATTQGVGSDGHRHPGRLQPVAAPALVQPAGGEDRREAVRGRGRPARRRRRDDRVDGDGRPGPGPAGPVGAARLGLSLAIDDFGTGYSSLARLKHLPVDILKIDRSFINDVDRDEDSGRMVEAMVQLARGLGMTPLAEGSNAWVSWSSCAAPAARAARASCSRVRCRRRRSRRSWRARRSCRSRSVPTRAPEPSPRGRPLR